MHTFIYTYPCAHMYVCICVSIHTQPPATKPTHTLTNANAHTHTYINTHIASCSPPSAPIHPPHLPPHPPILNRTTTHTSAPNILTRTQPGKKEHNVLETLQHSFFFVLHTLTE